MNDRKQYNKMLKKAKKHGFESTVMRPVSGGNQRQMIQAIVVPAEEIENHPDFADIREREGLGEGTSGVRKNNKVLDEIMEKKKQYLF